MTNVNFDMLDPQAALRETVAHLEHVLPGQGPILDFVHHNTIHGFQHKPFFEALADYEALTGVRGFQSTATSRNFYRQGRITDDDLAYALASDARLESAAPLCSAGQRVITRGEVYRLALLHDLEAPGAAQLRWQLANGGLKKVREGVGEAARALLCNGSAEPAALTQLWRTLAHRLGAPTRLDAEVEEELENLQALPPAQLPPREVAETFGKVGHEWSLRTLVFHLTGHDLLDTVRPQLARLSASLLDEGLARWHITDAGETSLYRAWLRQGTSGLQPTLLECDGAAALFAALPSDPINALHMLLLDAGIPQARWQGYLQRVALEIPGWAGLYVWRQTRPHYHTNNPGEPRLEDFLAIRLALDKLLLDRLCRETWHCAGSYQALLSHFQRNPAELHVRLRLHAGKLPEHLTHAAEALCVEASSGHPGHAGWDLVAAQLAHWNARHAPAAEAAAQAWRLFCLCQHLGLSAAAVTALREDDLRALRDLLDGFTPDLQGRTWLLAFERHYRDDVFTALAANRQRGGWLQRRERAQAQIIMCMDEREESFRRNLEELNPHIETFGAAGFFSIPMQYQGLDATYGTPLCPVVVKPAHRVDEVPRAGEEKVLSSHRSGWQRLQGLVALLHQHLRLNPLLAWCVIVLGAPVLFVVQLLDSLLPGLRVGLSRYFRRTFVPPVATELKLTAADHERASAPGEFHPGFTFKEQSERVTALLRTLGLTSNFAYIVALSGHGSTSQNNPHEAAHDCGACGGRQGGPNARAFAAMANRPEVRKLLAENANIHIPDDCWFVGTQHDTCSDAISWYDTDRVPEALRERFNAFRRDIERAQALSAHERCRRFASARHLQDPDAAFRHVTLRAQDGSQVRPEYGHATNAAAVIGRRQLTQGVFFDRRLFLISYDPTQDEAGKILENILLTAGPVGAGINLEYYFSTIDNERFGCGTKIPHNVTGLFGVMEGASSDLRTGLPLQMVEIHEAMRLQVICEAKTDVLARIYGDHPALQELVGGGWLLLSAVDPDTGAITYFDPARGFVPWRPTVTELPLRDKSVECYAGKRTPVAPMLIRPPVLAGA